MRIVLDTNVLLSATLWEGSESQKLLFRLIRSGADIVSSADLLSEYYEVLRREFGYAEEETTRILGKVVSCVRLVEPVVHVREAPDPGDDKVLECAIAALADYIVTYDKALLNMGTFRGIQMVLPKEVP